MRQDTSPPLADVKQAARGYWHHILTAAGIDAGFLKRQHGPCPICAGKDRFRFDDKQGSGSFFCNQCGAGDGFTLIQLTGKTFPESVRLVAAILGMASSQAPVRPLQAQTHKPEGDDTTERRKAALNAVWEGTREVQRGDPVWTYLTLRGIRLTAVPEALRYHRALDYWDEGRLINTFPAMVARVSAPDGLPATLHRTYLMPSGKKAPVSRVKKLMPPAKPGCPTHSAVRLHPAGTTLGIAEGIETALACHLATGIAVWAALSASFMPALVVPENVGKIIIFADNDEGGAGQTAASALARRLLSEGRKVKILAPDTPGTDWADDTAGSDERPWEN